MIIVIFKIGIYSDKRECHLKNFLPALMTKRLTKRKTIITSLGKRLISWRRKHSLKATELARVIGLAQSSLSEIENEKTLPSADTLARLSLKTPISIEWLLTGRGLMNIIQIPSLGAVHVYERWLKDKIDDGLGELLEKFMRIYISRDPVKKQYLTAFLLGADPGKWSPKK